MIETVILIALCSAYVYGSKIVIDSTLDFFDIDQDHTYLIANGQNRPRWQQFIMKPTFYCSTCMSSVHGAIFYFLLCGYTSFAQYAIIAICTAGIVEYLTFKRFSR